MLFPAGANGRGAAGWLAGHTSRLASTQGKYEYIVSCEGEGSGVCNQSSVLTNKVYICQCLQCIDFAE